MEPKPLTKERRAEIEAELAKFISKRWLSAMLDDVLAAEAFWRNAVKNYACRYNRYNSMGVCGFCAAIHDNTIHSVGNTCKPDCPWLLANQE